ncbi:MAG: radical SAM protein [Oscillospiraceae bacterium]|jgi:radical SAM protein with 4Fe4S-binding SPASM domain|nr:radical SAM protein [Oscillospiraceae bacterium]
MRKFYKLKKCFALRSFRDLGNVIVNLQVPDLYALNNFNFQALSFCDGKTDINSFFVTSVHKALIENFAKKGYVTACREGDLIKEEQKLKVHKNSFVKTVHWSITGRCNYKCRHCYLNAPSAHFGELSKEKCFKIIDQFKEAGIMEATITGGEPFVRKDFFEIIEKLVKNKISITQIYTNGKLITSRILDKLEAFGVKPEFVISFDGIGWHDWLRGVKGAEKLAVDALKLINKRGYTTSVEMCVHKNSIYTIRDTINFLSDLNVQSLKINPVADSGAWRNEKSKYNLTQEELFDSYLDVISLFFKDGSPLTLHLGGFFFCRKKSINWFCPSAKFDGSLKTLNYRICPHARQNVYISPNGQVLPCMGLAGIDNLNLKKIYMPETPLQDVLFSSDFFSLVDMKISDWLNKNLTCKNCSKNKICAGGCRASSILSGGGWFDIDTSACKIFKKGYFKKINNIAQNFIKNMEISKI